MRKTLANDPSKPGRQLSPDAKLDGRPAHSEAESVAEMSNLTARRAYNVTLESKVKDLSDQKSAAVVNAKGAEDRFKQLLAQKEELAGEVMALSEKLAVLQMEKKGEAELSAQKTDQLENKVASLEQQLQDQQARLGGKCDAAEDQARDMQRERETLVADRSRLLQENSTLTAEKRGLEELSRRLEGQLAALREEKNQVSMALESSDAKCSELSKQRESMTEERARMVEELGVPCMHALPSLPSSRLAEFFVSVFFVFPSCVRAGVSKAEKRGMEEMARREKEQMDDAVASANSRADYAEERAKEAGRTRDLMGDDKARLAEQLAVVQAEKRRADEHFQRMEASLSQMLDDKTASSLRADSADNRYREATAQKEAALSEKARAEEQLAVALADRKRVEEIQRLTEGKLRDELAAASVKLEFAENTAKEASIQKEAMNAEREKVRRSVPLKRHGTADATHPITQQTTHIPCLSLTHTHLSLSLTLHASLLSHALLVLFASSSGERGSDKVCGEPEGRRGAACCIGRREAHQRGGGEESAGAEEG